MAGNTSIVLGLSAGYNFNIAGEHNYGGPFPDSEVVRDLYEKDLAILSANYYQFGLNLKAIFPIGRKAPFISLQAASISALTKNFTTTAMVPTPKAKTFGGTSTRAPK